MTITKPTLPHIFGALLRSDFTTQTRRLRSGLMSILVPVIILFSWKNLPGIDGSFIIGSCMTIGIMSLGLLGYPVAVAQDREKGIFQRLRVTPAPSWAIMTSRLLVQLITIFIMAIVVIVAGYYINSIHLGLTHSVFGIIAAVCGGICFLSLGQLLVGLVKTPDAVNSAARLIYIPLVFGGAVASLGVLGTTAKNIVAWSPYGVTETILQAALHGSPGVGHVAASLLALLAYTFVFGGIGIRYFTWTSE